MNSNEEQQWKTGFGNWVRWNPPNPRPYFYTRLETRLETRLKARMAQSELTASLPWWLQRPAYAFGTLGVLIALNVAVALWQNSPSTPEADPGTYEAFVQDYQLDHQTVYADE